MVVAAKNYSWDLVGPCFLGASLDNLAIVSDNFRLTEADGESRQKAIVGCLRL